MDESKCYGLHSKKGYEQEPTTATGTLLYAFTLLGIGVAVGVVVTWAFSLIPL